MVNHVKPIFVAHIGIADVYAEDAKGYIAQVAKFLNEKLNDWHVVVSSDITTNTNRFEAFAVEKIEKMEFESLKKLLLKIENE